MVKPVIWFISGKPQDRGDMFMRIALLLAGMAGWGFGQAAAAPVMSEADVPVEPGARREIVAEGLEHPWSLAFLPDGAMLVTERPGRLRLIRDGKLDPAPIAGAPTVFAQNQGGLLDIALHPRFAETKWVYFTHAAGTAEANRTVLSRATLTAKGTGYELAGLLTLFEVSQLKRGGQHFGSRLAWLPNGTLLMSIGDGGNPPSAIDGKLTRDFVQDPQSHLGKILNLDENGKPAVGNAAVVSGARPEVYSLGHRNIQGLVYDSNRRSVWATEHGSLGGDELNRIARGGNHGWPVVSYTREYRGGDQIGARPGTGTAVPAIMTDPELVWAVAVAPSGLALYDGNAFPQWKGDLFSGSLMSQDIRRIDLDDSGKIKGETALRIGQRVRDIRQGPDGFLYVLTDERNGRLLRFVPDASAPAAPAALPAQR
jgi:glucose/arabinose dehydrogenase